MTAYLTSRNEHRHRMHLLQEQCMLILFIANAIFLTATEYCCSEYNIVKECDPFAMSSKIISFFLIIIITIFIATTMQWQISHCCTCL